MAAAAATKRVVVAVENTAAMEPYWQKIMVNYIYRITSFLEKQQDSEFALVTYGSNSASLLQRTAWTNDLNVFLMWLSEIPFSSSSSGGGDPATAEGLAESLQMMMMYQDSDDDADLIITKNNNHCILVTASNPHDRRRWRDAERVAGLFARYSVSLSVICPTPLAKVIGIYNAAARYAAAAANESIDGGLLVLISEGFAEARAAVQLAAGIVIGGLPDYMREGEIREMLEVFGPVGCLERDYKSNAAFCVYRDVAVADLAFEILPGIKVGDSTLTVRPAF